MAVLRLIDKCGGGGKMQKHKILLLACLFLVFILALPAQGQAPTATRTPEPIAQSCGLPNLPTDWTTAVTQTVWNMTRDCVMPTWPGGNPFIRVRSGDFTINGNGYSIIARAPGENFIVSVVQNSGETAVLRLNNLTISADGSSHAVPVRVKGGTMHLNNVIIKNQQPTQLQGRGHSPAWVDDGNFNSGGNAYFTNVQFINNRPGAITNQQAGRDPGSALTIWDAGEVILTNVCFRGNRNHNRVIQLQRATLRLRGYVGFEGNYDADGNPATDIVVWGRQGIDSTLDDQRTSSACPKKKKKEEARPTLTPTARPQIAATHIALQAETGATFRTTYGLDSGVHFRQLDGAGIGVQSIIDAGWLDAFDVYGYVEQGVEVCFPQIGRVIFLDANTIPRAIVPLDSIAVNGQTCVSIDGPGSLVLLPLE